MASSKDYLDFILEQLSGLEEIRFRPMMGEYLLYYRDRLAGGIYDDRLMVKAVPSALRFVENPILEAPYEGAKAMLLVEEVDNRAFLEGLLKAIYDELPIPKTKKKH